MALHFAHIVNAADVGVSHPPGRPDFVAESLQGVFVFRGGFR